MQKQTAVEWLEASGAALSARIGPGGSLALRATWADGAYHAVTASSIEAAARVIMRLAAQKAS